MISAKPQSEWREGMTYEKLLNGVGGMRVATLYEGIKRYPISVRYEQSNRADITSMGNIRIKTPYGYAPLKTFAKLYYKEAPSILKAEKGKKVIFIYITPNRGTTSQAYKKEDCFTYDWWGCLFGCVDAFYYSCGLFYGVGEALRFYLFSRNLG